VNDREYELCKQRATSMMRDWMNALSLSWWNVVVTYERQPRDDQPVGIVASYADADLRLAFNAPLIASYSDGELDTLIARVLIKAAFLDEVADQPQTITRVATVLARTLQNARQAGARGNRQGVHNAATRTATRNIGLVIDPDVRHAENG
jgi:hypothetical protein